MRVLVTNDDGIESPGLFALARAIRDDGHEVVIATSFDDRTGSGGSVGPSALTEGIPLERREVDGLGGVPCHVLDAPPALIVLLSQVGAFGPLPEAVAAGVNPGANLGGSVLHSGTVGAALTAGNLGLVGLAVSIRFGRTYHWDTAAALGARGLAWLAAQPRPTVLNLNCPNVPLDELKGVRWGDLAGFDMARSAVTGEDEGRVQVEFRLDYSNQEAGTDASWVRDGYASATVISGPRAIAPSDVAEVLERELLRMRGE